MSTSIDHKLGYLNNIIDTTESNIQQNIDTNNEEISIVNNNIQNNQQETKRMLYRFKQSLCSSTSWRVIRKKQKQKIY